MFEQLKKDIEQTNEEWRLEESKKLREYSLKNDLLNLTKKHKKYMISELFNDEEDIIDDVHDCILDYKLNKKRKIDLELCPKTFIAKLFLDGHPIVSADVGSSMDEWLDKWIEKNLIDFKISLEDIRFITMDIPIVYEVKDKKIISKKLPENYQMMENIVETVEIVFASKKLPAKYTSIEKNYERVLDYINYYVLEDYNQNDGIYNTTVPYEFYLLCRK